MMVDDLRDELMFLYVTNLQMNFQQRMDD